MGKPHFRIVAAFEDLDCATLLSWQFAVAAQPGVSPRAANAAQDAVAAHRAERPGWEPAVLRRPASRSRRSSSPWARWRSRSFGSPESERSAAP